MAGLNRIGIMTSAIENIIWGKIIKFFYTKQMLKLCNKLLGLINSMLDKSDKKWNVKYLLHNVRDMWHNDRSM